MIRCIAVDDEPWALALLSDYIRKVPFLQLELATGNPIEALQLVQNGQIDLAFLDIQMPEITGMQFLKIIGNKCRVILTTAYSEYALDGYDFQVIDYLLKPISFDRFYKAALRAQEQLQPQPQSNTVLEKEKETITSEYIFIKSDSRIVKVALNELLYIEGLKDYIAVHTSKEKIVALENMKTMEAGLPAGRFMRVHKSYIVALEQINTIERSRIFIREASIPIGDTYRDQFFAAIQGRHFG